MSIGYSDNDWYDDVESFISKMPEVKMTDLECYMKALAGDDINTCATIEQAHGLYGYPPQLVTIGLAAAAAKGENAADAVKAYLEKDE